MIILPSFIRVLGVTMVSSLLAQPAGCGDGRQQARRDLPEPTIKIERPGRCAFDNEQGLCEQTCGRWSQSFQACLCPENHIFSAAKGCFEGGQDNLVNFNETEQKYISPPFFDLMGIVLADRVPSDAALQPAWTILRGMSVEQPCEGSLVFVDYGTPTAFTVDRALATPHEGAAAAVIIAIDPATQAAIALAPNELADRCLDLGRVERLGPDADAELPLICHVLGRALAQPDAPETFKLPFARKLKGEGRGSKEVLLARSTENSIVKTLRIVRSGGASWLRTLELIGPKGTSLAMVLSPLGGVEAGKLMALITHDLPSATMMTEKQVFFSKDLVPFESQAREAGNREAIWASVQRASRGRNDQPPLRTDGERPVHHGKISAAVVERSIDLSDRALASRLRLAPIPTIRFLETKNLPSSLFTSGQTKGRLVAEILSEAGEPALGHGNLVAQIMGADIPDIAITLLPSKIVGDQMPQQAATSLGAMIEAQRPRVVNISMNFSDDIEDCDEVFGALFSRFEDSILFVAGAANDGASTVRDVCPAGLANDHANVISVAGVNSDGRLHPESNYGSEYVTLAAPYCVDIKGANKGDPVSRLCGTSVAAPLVTNRALRYILDHPGTKPSSVKAALMSECKPSAIDVACGGYVDLDEMIRDEPSAVSHD